MELMALADFDDDVLVSLEAVVVRALLVAMVLVIVASKTLAACNYSSVHGPPS